MKNKLTQERLKELLNYDPETGIFTRKIGRGGFKIGSIAGTPQNNGYIQICIDYKIFLASRLAFLWVEGYFPENETEHCDRDRANNCWSNLREASRSCNLRNRGVFRNNTSGITGVSWYKPSSKWQSHIQVNGENIHLGLFKTLFDAVQARWDAEVKHNFPNCNTTSSAYQYIIQKDKGVR